MSRIEAFRICRGFRILSCGLDLVWMDVNVNINFGNNCNYIFVIQDLRLSNSLFYYIYFYTKQITLMGVEFKKSL